MQKPDILARGAETTRPAEDDPSLPPAYSEHEEKDKDDDQSSMADSDSLLAPGDSPTPVEGPDVNHPFAFPTSEPPPYLAENHIDRPLAIPQTHPTPTASFVQAYPGILLSYGIPSSTWLDFVATLSSFLNASTGKNAILHATKIAQSAGDVYLELGKDIVTHTEAHRSKITEAVKKGNPIGLVESVVGSAVSWPMGIAGRVVEHVVHLRIGHVLTQKPQTPRERAEVYVAAANKKWFHARGFHALLANTAELAAEYIKIDGAGFANAIQWRKGARSTEQLEALRPWIGAVTVSESVPETALTLMASSGTGLSERMGPSAHLGELDSSKKSSKGKGKAQNAPAVGGELRLGAETLWLVLVQGEYARVAVDRENSAASQDSWAKDDR